MPCLNERDSLPGCIEEAQSFLRESAVDGEVLIADNNSTDGSQELAKKLGARVVEVPVAGYGAALYAGTCASRGRYIIMGDADGSYDFSSLMPFLAKLREGFDLVVGNRFAGGIQPGAMPWKNRYLGNPILSGIGRLFFRPNIQDFHCGIRGISREAFDSLDLRTTGMEYASEMVISATIKQLRVAEVSTSLRQDSRSRRPHLRPWRDGWRHLRFMLLYSPEWLFMVPGLACMITGLIVGARLWVGPWSVAGITFDFHTLVFAALATLLGFQVLAFGVSSKIFAIREGLLPESPRLKSLFEHFTLEIGLLIGLFCVVLGLSGIISSLLSWYETDFGDLIINQTLRNVIVAATITVLGLQVIFTSFFLSILGLKFHPKGVGEFREYS